jgi:hypothetical protein
MVLNPRFKLKGVSAVTKEIARYLIYAVLVYLIADFAKWSATIESDDTKFSETSYVEYAQTFLLLLVTVISLKYYFSKNSHGYKHILLLFAGLSSMALIREQDVYFEKFIGHGIWPLPVLAIICVVGYKVFKSRKEVWTEIALYVKTKSYAFFTFATLTIFIFSRLFGRTKFWEATMGDRYFRIVKNVAEETLELYGYLFFVIAVIELLILVKEEKSQIVKSEYSSNF